MDVNPVRNCGISEGLQNKATTYIEHREFGEDCTEFFVERVLCELDFAHIEAADAANLEVFMDYLSMRVKITSVCANVDNSQWVSCVGS